ncbi:MAG TPA: diguanylate cyclase [Conexibacter sp.]|nr:diguanylate cyclase [Conexibacter sp.]
MSFRARLTLFFVLIVVVPMIALGVVVVRLISQSEKGKASARGGAYATATVNAYRRIAARDSRHARILARDPVLVGALQNGDAIAARNRAGALAHQLGLARVRLVRAHHELLDLGDATAVAAGAARIHGTVGGLVEVSTISAARFAQATGAPGVRIVVVRDGALLAGSLPSALVRALPQHATLTLGGTEYTLASFHAADFDGSDDAIAVLTDTSGTTASANRGRWIAVALLAGFLVLAFLGALLISRQLHGQLERFLVAAKRIGSGDFSTTVPIEGDDEFAALGREFNKMSGELEQRIAELAQERIRLRESIQRIGATFAANLDRSALLEIGTQAAVDAVEASCGRATVRMAEDGDLLECARVGDIAGAEAAIAAAEAQARAQGVAVATSHGAVSALAAPIAREGEGEDGILHGLVAVARAGAPFGEEERELVASLARQTGISLENVELHDQVKLQAVTDELTGLFNFGRFQEVVTNESAAAVRFGQPLGLVLLDIDDFKQVNDTYGHPQGDVVLREVARILRESSREIDEPARYGGEEMAVALPQTDLEGAYVIAERIRVAVDALRIPRLDGGGTIGVTVSCGVAAAEDGDKVALIAAADAALYRAKRAGKNRTERAAEPASAAR